MKQSSKVYLYFSALILLVIVSGSLNPFIKDTPHTAVSKPENDALYQKIKDSANQYNQKPENAYIDRVWKKTPGRNGREVDLTASYKKMKKEGKYSNSLLVFEETPPEITLKDLPASPIYRGHPKKQMVSLMINVSWGEEFIPSILKTLKEENVKATFFIEGKWAAQNKNLVKMIHEQHHLIGNHAYNHPDMKRLSQTEMRQQIAETNGILEAIIDYQPKWFAPPSGSFNQQVVEIADELSMETVLWTTDTIDWQNPAVSVMINRVKENLHPGATILMHPTEPVAEGLEELIQEIKAADYNIGSVEALLSEKR